MQKTERKINKIIVHCSDSKFGDREAIDCWHKFNGWDEIGYNYVICNGVLRKEDEYVRQYDGLIQKGRSLNKFGAHSIGDNRDSIGICLIGVNEFTPRQMYYLVRLITALKKRYGKLKTYGHCERPNGLNYGKTCPNFDIEALRRLYKL